MADLAASFARSLGAAPVRGQAKNILLGQTPRSVGRGGTIAAPRAPGPVLQLNAIPVSIDLEKFSDAHSSDNPGGDYEAAYRLRNLCNAIPSFKRNFDPSGHYVESVWRNIAFGATGTTSYARHLLSAAQADIDGAEVSNLGGSPKPWLPVDAVPSNWTELLADAPECELDLGGDGGSGDYVLIDQAENLAWTGLPGSKATPIEGKLQHIRLRALRVDLNRSWLDFQLLAISGWKINGMPGGFFSSGTQADNSGIFPLLPTALVIGTDIIVEGDWSHDDLKLMRQHAAEGRALGIGPFPLAAPALAAGTPLQIQQAHVIGVISALVPYAPQATDLDPGVVLVKNDGGFIARFAVDWRLSGRPQRSESGSFPVAAAKRVDLPAGATDIALTIEIMTFPAPFETWKVLTVRNYDTAPRASFRLSGTTIDTAIEEQPAFG
jgi:hypothetical protein